MSIPCARCARSGASCCRGYQIALTAGDISRISQFTGTHDFWTVEDPVREDIAPDYDPSWLPLISQADGGVKVLRRVPDKTCFFLSETGCTLPAEKRPLICRLYPYIYTENHILGIDQACPISRYRTWNRVLCKMAMPRKQAGFWVASLYNEMRELRRSAA